MRITILLTRQILEHRTLLLGGEDPGTRDDAGKLLQRHAREVDEVDRVAEYLTFVPRARVFVLSFTLALRPSEASLEELQLGNHEALELEDPREEGERDVGEAAGMEDILGSGLDEQDTLLDEGRFVIEQALLVDEAHVVRVQVFLQVCCTLCRQGRDDVFLTDVEDRQHQVIREFHLVAV